MLIEKIDSLIASAMKERNAIRLETLRLIKKDLTDKSKSGEEYNIVAENKVLQKMVDVYTKSIEEFKKGNREDLVKETTEQLEIIKEFAPKVASNEEIEALTINVIGEYSKSKGEGYKLTMKDMKPILTIVQETFPTANGKVVSMVLKEKI